MAEVQYFWPPRGETQVIGKEHDRIDGVARATGAAKYTYDIRFDGMLVAKGFSCPHGHCRIKAIDTTAAERVPGVVHVEVLDHAKPGSEINWEGELLAVVAAETEGAAREGVSKIKVDYEPLDVWVDDQDLEGAEAAGRTSRAGGSVRTVREPGEDEDEDEFAEKEIQRLLDEAAYKIEGFYGASPITHCPLETHGITVRWEGDKLLAYLSTQGVSTTDDALANSLGITADNVEVRCDYVGGAFGSKFAPDYWGVAAARIAKATGRPVKLMLDRDQELKIGGNRPSGYARVRLGADKDGMVTVWDAKIWGTSGSRRRGGGVSYSVVPYVYRPENYRTEATGVNTNAAPSRAWRAPNHPQACLLTQAAYDDLAAAMGADSFDIFMKNIEHITSQQKDPNVYREELKIAARLMDWRAKWHPHGKGPADGSIVYGLGIGLNTWAGGANTSNCLLKIYPDGGVESFCGAQDLGTGTRTVCAMVLAETFGLPVEAVRVNIGSSTYPFNGPSGGSTTVGAVSESHRRAGQQALAQLLALAAKELDVPADQLEAVGGRIRVKGGGKSLSWKEACSLLGLKPLETTASYSRGTQSPLSDSGVGGVQMAHVLVDKETGVVKMKKFVAVQDQGLVINPQTAKSQIIGAVTMGIAYSLFEERILDPKTGAFLNAELDSYKLPRIGDVGEIVAEIYEPDDQRARGVIGNGEPPVIAVGAAISNAVANALGVRAPVIPITPKRVLDALRQAGRA